MKDELDELERLEYRYLNSRAAKASTRSKPEPKESPKEEKPEIHVHIDMPEVKETPKVEAKVDSPKKWVFKHKYDRYNKLVETTATAE